MAAADLEPSLPPQAKVGDATNEQRRDAEKPSRSAALFQPVDIASLAVFRIGYGLMMTFWAVHYLWIGRVRDVYVAPRFHFTYPGLDFLTPWPGTGMYLHFGALALLGLLVAAGLRYRVTSVLLAAGFTYVFLLERANYQNHYYLLTLISWSMTIMPVHRAASLDVLNGTVAASATIPAWCLALTRLHIGLPYFFGGVAKFNSDWLAGAPMRAHLSVSDWRPVFGGEQTFDLAVLLFTWGGLVFDLAVVPALLWKPTRAFAYLACVAFHLMNAVLFQIHIFPWFMIFATTIFFSPSWPRRLLRLPVPRITPAAAAPWSTRRRVALALGAAYCVAHLLVPLRHTLYDGETVWTERGHYFAWRMMLRGKSSAVRYFLTDRQTGETGLADVMAYVSPEQLSRLARDPEMILHCAHQLADAYHKSTGRDFEVRALVLCSLNGRKPQLLIDPNVDLTRLTRGSSDRPWVMPLTEPLRKEPWSAPMTEWEQAVAIPELEFLKRQPAAGQAETGRSSEDSSQRPAAPRITTSPATRETQS